MKLVYGYLFQYINQFINYYCIFNYQLTTSYIICLFFFQNTVFAYGETFVSLLVARSLQGTASALISVSGITCY